jgi:uncharacterized phage protein (TIGR01671 family)
MIREIKFRAWDGNKMLSDIPLDGSRLGINDFIYGSALKVMQFTGLKTADDYGEKEIYEGDIVFNHTVDRKEAGVVEFSDIHHAYIIRYKDKKGRPQDFDEMHGVEHNLEVIGNIYENSELLK